MQAVFSGFDSAWSPANSGAICDLLWEGDSLRLFDLVTANWNHALVCAEEERNVDLHVWAIDQPILVRNADGCRPVERGLASALMGDFGCGAHSSNLGLSPWAEGAPIWKFICDLQKRGYQHDPMAIPGSRSGRFYFECYPHPAILGLFELGKILKYKVHHRNRHDWQMLIGLFRSLASAELAIQNICSYVPDDLPQNKKNEDKLDSIISAYVAAYWWKFGVTRSTSIGDLSTGYMVTPHSARTFAAMARVFAGRINLRGAVTALPPKVLAGEEPGAATNDHGHKPHPGTLEAPERSGSLPYCDWVYFATSSKWSGTVTREFVRKHRVIVRNIYNSACLRISNVQHLRPGETILLVHGGKGQPYRALFSCTITESSVPVRTSEHSFNVFSYIDESLNDSLKAGGYALDPVVKKFTGISISDVQDLQHIDNEIPRPPGNTTIRRWDEVFGLVAEGTSDRHFPD